MAGYQGALDKATAAANTPFTPYAGELVAGFSPDQLAAMGKVSGIAGAAGTTPVTGMVGDYMSPFTQNVIDTTLQTINQQNDQQQEALTGNAISSGAWGGDRAGIAKAVLAGQQDMAKNATIAGLNNQGYQSALQTAMLDRSAMLQEGLAGANAQLQTGGLQQGLDQNTLNTLYNQWLIQQQYPFQTSQFLTSAASALGPGMGGTSATTAPAPSAFSQIAGLGLAGLGLFGSGGLTSGLSAIGNGIGGLFSGGLTGWSPGGALSDERAKEDIEPVGQLDNGQTVYRFRYKGDPTPQIGLLAQEVEQSDPGAVTEGPGGFKYVDYDRATERAGGGEVSGVGGAPITVGSAIAPVQSYVPVMSLPAMGGRGFMPQAPAAPKSEDIMADITRMAPMLRELRNSMSNSAKTVPAQDTRPILFSGIGGGIDSGKTFKRGGMVRGYDDGGEVQPGIGGPLAVAGLPEIAGALPSSGIVPVAAGDADAMTSLGVPSSGQMGMSPDLMMPSALNPGPSVAGIPATAGVGVPSAPVDTGTSEVALPPDAAATQASGFVRSPEEKADPWMALVAAGLGMAASKSPYPGVAIGEGGLAGLQFYSQEKQRAAQENYRRAQMDSIANNAKRLEQQFDIQMKRLDVADKKASQWRTIRTGTDSNGNPIYQQEQPSTGEVRDLPGRAPAGAQGGDDVVLPTGEEYLSKYVPAGERNLIKRLASYDIDPRTLSTKGGHRENLLKKVAQYDPNYSQADYANRSALKKSFTSGKDSEGIASWNMVMQHVGELEKAIKGLDNTRFPILNKAKNYWNVNVAGDPKAQEAISDFRTAAKAVAVELTKAFKGAGVADVASIKDWQHDISEASTPAQLNALTRQAVKLLSGRVNATGDKYNSGLGLQPGMSGYREPDSWLSSGARKTYHRLMGDEAGGDEGAATEKPAAAPRASAAPELRIQQAQAAIKSGKDPVAVRRVLEKEGIDPSLAGL